MNLSKTLTSFEAEKLFEWKDFTAQLCCSNESKSMAYALRYKAYRHFAPSVENKEGMVYDEYDAQKNTRTHLIWYQGKAIASVRSSIWSAKYDWEKVESINSFPKEVDKHIGLEYNMLESSRYVVDPEITGRTSLNAQLLMFRIQDLSSQVDRCGYVLTSVREKHVPFYKRMLAFQQISEGIPHELVLENIVLLMTTQEDSRNIVVSKGMPPCTPGEVERYRQLLNEHQTSLI